MSAITYLTNIVTSLTNRFNQLEANSKKVDELPAQTTLEPTSKIPVSRGGVSEYITAQQIISSIQNSNYNQLTSVGDITVDGTDIIVEPVSGQINGNVYATSTDTTIPITLCPTGFNRKDILVLTTSNTVIAISGEETDGAIVIAPLVPLDAIYITEFDVSDSAIGVTTPPIVGTQFKQKNESRKFSVTASGTDYAIELRTAGHQHYAVSGTVTSIAGFSKALITASPTAEVPYSGKDFFFENKTDHDVTLKNAFSSVDIAFNFGVDLAVPSNGIVWLKYNAANETLNLFFKSWSEVDLSTKLDKVSTAGVERAYIINADGSQGTKATSEFKDVLEFANLASFPVTGESGKIYVALDTNFTYRWSGSAYVYVGGGKRYQTLLFQSSATVTLPADQKNLHQSRFTVGSSVFSTLGFTNSSGIPEPGGVLDLSYMSDACVPNITPNYISKVVNVTLSYSRNVAESGANTNVKIRLISDTKYKIDIQKICEFVITSSTLLGNAEGKVTIPILTHLPLSANSNLKWTIRSNNGVAQQFNILRLNVDIEEI